MKKKTVVVIVVNILALTLLSWFLTRGRTVGTRGENLQLYYFGESTCAECNQVKTRYLQPLEEKYGDLLSIAYVDLVEVEGYSLLLRLEEERGITDGAAMALFFPDTALLGYAEITRSVDELVAAISANPARWGPVFDPDGEDADALAMLEKGYSEQFSPERFWSNFTTISILGLLDGINPCALGAMVFLISFLATQKRPAREIFIIGQSFIAASYVTYYLLGVGAFGILSGISGNRTAAMTISLLAIQLCLYVAVYSFRDAVVYHRTRRLQDMKLQMTTSTKMRIHSAITGNMGKGRLVGGAVIAGFVVTLLESTCTMYSYLPMLKHLARGSKTFGLQASLWLVWYCFLFIIPLQIVMIAAYKGMTWDALAKKTQKNLVALRVTIGCAMLGLALYLGMHL